MLLSILNFVLAESPIVKYKEGFVVKHNGEYLQSSSKDGGRLKTVSLFGSASKYKTDSSKSYPSMMIALDNKAVDYSRGSKVIIAWSKHGGSNQRVSFDQLGETTYRLKLLGKCITKKNEKFVLSPCRKDNGKKALEAQNQIFEILPLSIASLTDGKETKSYGFLENAAHLMIDDMGLSKSSNKYKFANEDSDNYIKLAFEPVNDGFYSIKMLSDGASNYLDSGSLPNSIFKSKVSGSLDQMFKIDVSSETDKTGKIISLADGKCLYVTNNGLLDKHSCSNSDGKNNFTFQSEIIKEEEPVKPVINNGGFMSVPDTQGFITSSLAGNYLTNNADSLMAKKFKLIDSEEGSNRYYVALLSKDDQPTAHIFIKNHQVTVSNISKTALEVEISHNKFYQFRYANQCFEYDENASKVVLNKCNESVLQLFEIFNKVTDKSAQKLNKIRQLWGSYGFFINRVNPTTSNHKQCNPGINGQDIDSQIEGVQAEVNDIKKIVSKGYGKNENVPGDNLNKKQGTSTRTRKRIVTTKRTTSKKSNPVIDGIVSSHLVATN